MTESGKEYTYRYDKRGSLTEEQKSGIPIRRYAYDATGRMVMGKNLENGEKTQYTYNALYMRTSRIQTLSGSDAFHTKETSYLPDYLSPTNNDLMAYEQGVGAIRTIYGRGYERFSQKVTLTGEAGTGTALPEGMLPASAETLPPEMMIGASVIGKTYFQPDIYGSPLFASNEQGQALRYAERNIWGDLRIPLHNDLNISGLEDSLRFTSYAYDTVIGKYFAQARFYDSSKGRMLSKDPIKRGLNGYHYCNDDPVNYVDPTGEIANILVGGGIGAIVGGTFGFINSAVSQLISGEGFDSKKAWGAAANGAVVGAVKGAVAGSGVGLPLAVLADFTAGTTGSALEQWISEGEVSARKSITSGLTNAVSGAIYGNNPMKSFKQALGRGAASGAATSGIDYLSSLFEPQTGFRRSPGIQYQGGTDGILRPRDPKSGCTTPDPTIGSLRYGKDYGYQYNVPATGENTQSGRSFSLTDFIKEVLTGAATGGMAGATFYGAGKAVKAVKESIGRSHEQNYILYNKTHENSLPRPKGTGPNGGRLQSHHGLQKQWAIDNLSQYGYDPKLAPTVTIETGRGMPHTTISNLQNARRDVRVASGTNKWSSNLQDELSYIVSDFRTAGFSDSTIRKVLKQQYKMLDELNVLYERIKF